LTEKGERDALLLVFEKRRGKAYDEAQAVMNSNDATIAMLAIRKLIAKGCCSLQADGHKVKQWRKSARGFARQVLDKRKRQVFRLGANIGGLSDGDRHQLRIALKKLRYVSEFFGTLFAKSKTSDAYVAQTATLQELLGRRNDFVDALRILGQTSQCIVAQGGAAHSFIREERVTPSEF
jgi:triphosphatase